MYVYAVAMASVFSLNNVLCFSGDEDLALRSLHGALGLFTKALFLSLVHNKEPVGIRIFSRRSQLETD